MEASTITSIFSTNRNLAFHYDLKKPKTSLVGRGDRKLVNYFGDVNS